MDALKKMTESLERKGKSRKVVIVVIMRKLAVLVFNLYTKGQVCYDLINNKNSYLQNNLQITVYKK